MGPSAATRIFEPMETAKMIPQNFSERFDRLESQLTHLRGYL